MKYQFNSECNLGDISITENVTCEHCGKMEPFEPVVSNGCTYYCLRACWDMMIGEEYDDQKIIKIPKSILKETAKRVVEARKKHYTKMLKEVDDFYVKMGL